MFFHACKHVVHHQDSGFDIELESTDDYVKLMELHKKITGQAIELSWAELAGIWFVLFVCLSSLSI